MGNPSVEGFFHEETNTVSYVVWDPQTSDACIIDPVLDFDAPSGAVSTAFASRILSFIKQRNLHVCWILETHAHADHLTAAQFLKAETGAPVAIGIHINAVQAEFAPRFLAHDVHPDGSAFDRLIADGEVLPLGVMGIRAMHTPGHTPACMTYIIGDAAFVGDTMFMPDYGTARADFPGGDARTLFRSIHSILCLSPSTRIFVGHDYLPKNRDHHAWQTTVADETQNNVHVGGGVGQDAFVAMREARDATLSAPALLLPSLQVNIRAGRMPPADADGIVRLKLPLTGSLV